MEEEDIITQTLSKLDNWVLDTKIEEDELTDMDYNKSVTSYEGHGFTKVHSSK